MLCCDISRWNELGPVQNAVIRNNVFDGCGVNFNRLRGCGVVIGVDHNNLCAGKTERNQVHGTVKISGNTFIHLKDPAIFADAVSKIEITDNAFVNCCHDKANRPPEYCSQTVLFHCDDVKSENNTVL